MDALEAGDAPLAQSIAADYIAHMQDRTAHFDTLARQVTGDTVPHILLLHMNQIKADHLGQLLDWYANEGWGFVTVAEAMADPFYGLPDIYAGCRRLNG